MTQGEHVVTSSVVIPCNRGIRSNMAEITTKYQYKLLRDLQSSIENLLKKYEIIHNFKISAVLVLRFKLKELSIKYIEKSINQQTLIQDYKAYNQIYIPATASTSSPLNKIIN